MSELEKNDEIQEETKGKPISELRVCELKAELDKRGLSSAGVKAVLTARLNKALRDEGINTDEHRFAVARTPTASPMKGRPKRGKEVEEKKAEQEQEMEQEERAVDSSPEPEDSQGLRIVEDSFELREHEEQLKIEKEPEIVEQKGAEPEIQELEEQVEEIQEQKEPEQKEPEQKIDIDASEKMEQEEKKEEKSEEKNEEKTEEEDEEVEGEDEFEEVEEPKNSELKDSEPKEPEPKEQSADELDLEEEELLEDPLDEVVEPKSTTKEVMSMSTTNSESNSSLFGDEAKKTSIWIRGMSPSTKASSVKQLASQFGKVIQSKIFNSKPINGEIKNCFALVIFAEPESMENAIRALHRKEHDGRVVRVEKVADSNLTGSAERVAKERKEQTEKEQEEAKRQEMRKKRAVILAPEEPKPPRSKPARQTIQAPEPSARKNRAIIEAPARSRSRERNEKRARKPITYEQEEDSKRSKRETSHDSRRTIAAPAARGARVISPPPRSSSHRHHDQPSLIISARVDTSGCRGGGPIKRSVERSVPNNISTSELRRKIAPAPPRSGFSRARVDFPPDDEHYGGRSQPAARQDYEYSRHHQERSHRYQEEPVVYQDNRRSDRENREREKQREREMIETYRRKEQEHRLREEKLQIEREREKMRFEQEKLERAKLELELTKQKLALQQATFASRAPSSSSSSRRRDDSSAPRAKMHTEDRKRRDSEVKMSNRIPSARHVAAEYGIQANLGNSSSSMHTSPARGATLNNSYGSPSKNYERYRSNYEASNYQQGYQQQQQRYEGNNYQQQMWAGLDSTGGGQMTMETHWTGDSSASSSATSVGWQHQNNQNHQNNQYSNNQSSSSSNRRDYGYTRGHY